MNANYCNRHITPQAEKFVRQAERSVYDSISNARHNQANGFLEVDQQRKIKRKGRQQTFSILSNPFFKFFCLLRLMAINHPG